MIGPRKTKILECVQCGTEKRTKHKNHTHRCCGARMHICAWELEVE